MKLPPAISSNRVLGVLLVVFAVYGGWLGYALAGHAGLQTYKLLNIVGVVYGLLGVIVLSELVVKSEPLKNFMVRWVSPAVAWANAVIPLSALVGVLVGRDLPSAGAAAAFLFGLFAYSVLPMSILEFAVFNPPPKLVNVSVSTRNQVFGLVLLLTGMVIQLIAALLDFRA